MAVESFSNLECAALINDSFVPVIIDREERPDIDAIYLNYVQAVNNSGGWPLNIFATPELEPVFGGTYWPGPRPMRRGPAERDEEPPDFLTILKTVRRLWREQEPRCRHEAAGVLTQLRDFAAEGTLGTRSIAGQQTLATANGRSSASALESLAATTRSAPLSSELDLDLLEEAYTHIAGTFDPVYGGFGLAPKFLTPAKLAFLLNLKASAGAVRDIVGGAECQAATEMALETLRKIRDSALHDLVGQTGFARCSITPDWSIPNFEKLVTDNALLLGLYLDAWQIGGGQISSEFYDVVIELVDYLTTPPIALPGGGVASSEAADSPHRKGDADLREGAFYLWTRREFDSVLDAIDKHISPIAAAYWDVLEDGNVDEDHDPYDNFINQNILRVVRTPEALARQYRIPETTVQQYIHTARQALKARRDSERLRPSVDRKIITGWNGLAISALARGAATLRDINPTKAEACLHTAVSTVNFIKDKLWDEQSSVLYRMWDRDRQTEGFADDYAYLILALLDIYATTEDDRYLDFAEQLQQSQIRHFHDPSGGAFFSTAASTSHVVLRLKDGMDTSLPATNAVTSANLFRLGELRNDAGYTALGRETVDAFEPEILQHPWLFSGLLQCLVTARLSEDGGSA